MGELATKNPERSSMLQAYRDDGAETLHQSRDRRALLCHPDEDLTWLTIRIEAYCEIALVAGDGEMVCDARALVWQAMAVGSRRTRQVFVLCCFSVRRCIRKLRHRKPPFRVYAIREPKHGLYPRSETRSNGKERPSDDL